MQNARLDESQARIKIARENTNNLRYAADTTHPFSWPYHEHNIYQWETCFI